MKISKSTLDLLKNFSTINTAILVKPGKEICTVNNAKTVVAFANVPEDFPVQFGIYDLNNFISTVNLFEDPDISFDTNHMTITGGASKCSYGYAEESVIATPKKRLSFPSVDVEFDLTRDVFDRIMKASSTLSLPILSVTKDAKNNIVIRAIDPKNPNANVFSVVVGTDLSDKKYVFNIQTELLKMVRGDYKVSISQKCLLKFEATDIEYYVAAEKSSEYSEPSVVTHEDEDEPDFQDNE